MVLSDEVEADKYATSALLTDRFIVPPFSVLDGRAGYWQERKGQWLAPGIQGELGRVAGRPRPGGGQDLRAGTEAARTGGGGDVWASYSRRADRADAPMGTAVSGSAMD